MPFVNQALARRFEAAEEMPQVLYAEIDRKLRPEIGSVAEKIAGGHAIFAGLGSPIGHAGGIGFGEGVTEADLDHLEEFYRSRNAPAQVDVCPFTEPALLEMLKKRSYVLAEMNNVLARRVVVGEKFPAPPAGAEIRAGTVAEAPVLAGITQQCFFPEGNAPAGFEHILTPMYQLPGAISFVATVAGEMAAVGGGLVIPEHRILALYGAGTLPAYRGRGLQTALFQRRLQVAAEAGCEFAVVVTQGGTTSQRNAERLGFGVAYSKATVVKNW
jgi:GNAT superfamily N-acetyltransferase